MAMEADTRIESPETGPETEGLSFTTSHQNPRRCSPSHSVSLKPALESRFNSFQPSNAPPASTDGQPGSIVHRGRHEAQQRPTSPSSALEWFKRTNENVKAQDDGLLHESPFFLDSNPNDSHSDVKSPHLQGWGGAQFASRDSENSDLRDVIDDLTIENRKLKQQLKRYKRSQRSDMHRDKMVEVRMHGLSASKQRDLEELLRDFVTKANMKDRRAPGSSTNNSSNYKGAASHSRSSKPGLSLSADSGYASMSKSGSQFNFGPASISMSSQRPVDPRLSSKSRNKSIQSYLHNIPESLMPKVMPAVMTERERMKLVVQRLEHVFTGRSAAAGPHTQPMQQQEVSNSAARDDHFKFEGAREARIMTTRQRRDLERRPKRRGNSHSDGSDDSPYGCDRPGLLGCKSPDQRPTRPLDLDVHRAQVPSENLNYIRHLGLPSPTRHGDQTDDGWVYLNLLTSMAQLHTINVTPAFIKRAVMEVSEKLELSADGRKIRWKGGEEGTMFSSDSGSNAEVKSGESPPESNSSQRHNRKVTNNGHASKNSSSSDILSSRCLPSRSTSGKILLSESAGKSLSPYVKNSKLNSASQFGMDDTTGHSSSNHMKGSSERPSVPSSRGDGSIIYYRNAIYYADLHGDRRAFANAKAPVEGKEQYILGLSPTRPPSAEPDARQALPESEVGPIRPEEYSENDFPSLNLVPLSNATETHQDFQEFPVSGIGGVVPEDNFLIDVKTKHSTKPQLVEKQLRRQSKKNYEVVSTEKLDLPPSNLPPPSYIFSPATSSSSSDVDDINSEEDGTDSSVDEYEPSLPAMINQNLSNSYYDGSDDEAEEDDDDSSIDMLHPAEAANPEAVASHEREYDMNMDAILPDELPAGSSAATAGGGSGYASPVRSLMSIDMDHPSVKRPRSTTDSIAPPSRSKKTPRR